MSSCETSTLQVNISGAKTSEMVRSHRILTSIFRVENRGGGKSTIRSVGKSPILRYRDGSMPAQVSRLGCKNAYDYRYFYYEL